MEAGSGKRRGGREEREMGRKGWDGIAIMGGLEKMRREESVLRSEVDEGLD